MTNKKSTNKSLSAAIVFAGIVIAGSLVFFGISLKSSGGNISDEDFREQLDKNLLISLEKLDSEEFINVLDNAINDVAGSESPDSPPTPAEPEVLPEDLTMEDLVDDDPVLGDPDAPITMVEFSDYQCYYCQSFYNNTLPDLKEKYIETGQVKLVYRDLPLESIHPAAYDAAMFGECVREESDDETYFTLHNYLFENIGSSTFDYEKFAEYAVSDLGINRENLDSCFENREYEDEVYEDIVAATDLGIGGTPSFVINGEIVKGAVPLETLEEVFEDYL